MARAKRTDRAEARRRHRAALEASMPDAGLAADETDEPQPAATRGGAARGGATQPAAGAAPQRPSIMSAFRGAFRPIDLRGDLRALPLIVTHWSFYVPVILSGLAVALVPLAGLNPLTIAFFQYFSFTAPLGVSFLAGFFAPRAAYLVGILTALASVGFQALAYSVGPFGGFLEGFQDASGNPLTQEAAKALVLNQALFTGIPSGAIFAAAAAWYKRFLARANPSRRRPPSASGRRPDGRTPKKNQQRPILARRR